MVYKHCAIYKHKISLHSYIHPSIQTTSNTRFGVYTAYLGTEYSHSFACCISLELTQNKIPITMFSKAVFIFWQTS